MCGICGYSGSHLPSVLSNMNDALIHRGPDELGEFRGENVHLAMRRLSIVDLAKGGQPSSNETKDIHVVFNGEIYNHQVLREQLEEKGHQFRSSHSDTEVIVHLYEEEGDNWAKRVNGMFAVAIFDQRDNSIRLYRDRIGQKPLYYSEINGELIFASEIKSVLKHPAVSRKLDYSALYSYFALKNISAPATIFSDVRELLPGECLIFKEHQTTRKRYWEVDFSNSRDDVLVEDAVEEFTELLDDAVRIRMSCDVPYGAYLSGGVDSSAVVAMMRKHSKAELMTFCLGYSEHGDGQFLGKQLDMEYSQMMAERFATTHFVKLLSSTEFAKSLPDVLTAFDQPFSGTVSTYFLSPLIRDHVKVALSGDGADELFGSYLVHRLAQPIENLLRLEQAGKYSWQDLSESEKRSLEPFHRFEDFDYLRGIADKNLLIWRDKLSVFSHQERQSLLTSHFREAAGQPAVDAPCSEIFDRLRATEPLNRVLEWDQQELLPNQVLPFVDRLSMAHSVEVRSPFLDYRIIEFANNLPSRLKIRGRVNKYIHKKAMSKLLPQDLLDRPKEGFVQPNYTWMHGSLKSWTLEHLRSLPTTWFIPSQLDSLMKAFLSGDVSTNAKVWNLVCLSVWLQDQDIDTSSFS